jgi:hypothetical protein
MTRDTQRSRARTRNTQGAKSARDVTRHDDGILYLVLFTYTIYVVTRHDGIGILYLVLFTYTIYVVTRHDDGLYLVLFTYTIYVARAWPPNDPQGCSADG